MNNFTQLNLNQNINKAIIACGYTEPTPIQAKSIPEVLQGRDLVASAQTGTGKTAAFVLPALHRLSEQTPSKKTRILILTPTRELASQITKAAGLYGKFLRFNIVNLVGGMPYHQQIRDLARGADIIVATPGRLMDHMNSKRVDLSSVEMLVLDEADRMLDMGFIEDVEYIAKLTPANRQTLLFSATVDKKLTTIVRHLLKNPVRIDLSNEKLSAPKITQELYKTRSPQHKIRLLKHFLNDSNIYKAIIFSGTKINADKLADQLCDEGYSAAALHGDLRQNVRNRTIEQLRRGKIQFLVATDVAARGIDISDITHVFNYDMPKFCEDYVHRIGRTGRAGKTGTAISFVLPSDTRHIQRIERYIGQRLKVMQNVELSEAPKPKNDDASAEVISLKKDRQFDGERRDRSFERGERDVNRPKKRFTSDRDQHAGSRHKKSAEDGYRSRKPSGSRDNQSTGGRRYGEATGEGYRDRKPAGRDGERRARSIGRDGEHRERSTGRDGEHRARSTGRDGEHRARSTGRDGEHRPRSTGRDGEHRPRSTGRDGEHRARSTGRDGEHRARSTGRDGEHRARSTGRDGEHRARSTGRDGERRERTADRDFNRPKKTFSGGYAGKSGEGFRGKKSAGKDSARPFKKYPDKKTTWRFNDDKSK